MSRRSEQLRAIAEEYTRVHSAWVDDENRPVPDQTYWDAVDAMIESFGNGDVPGDCRPLADAVDAFAEEVAKWDDRDDPKDLMPGNAFWSAREAIERQLRGDEDRKARTLAPLQSIAVLAAQGVSHAQIAKIYGFRDQAGRWMPHLVQREIDQPGSVLKTPGAVDGRDWSDPRLAGSDGNAAAEKHAQALADKRQKAKKGRQPCKESPEELWRQGVSVRQSAKMLAMDEPEVAKLFAGFDADRERELTTGEKVDATTQAIRELHAKGRTVKQIVEELRGKVDGKAVSEAIKSGQATGQAAGQVQQPAAAGAA